MGMDTRNPRGFSLVELLVGAGILSVALLVVATSGMFMTRLLGNKELAFLRAQQLEQRLVESLQEHHNFSFELRNRLRDGARFPAFTLKFGAAVKIRDIGSAETNEDVVTEFDIPEPHRDLDKLKPSIAYYNLDGRKCGAVETAECPIGVAIAMIQIAGTYDHYTYGGPVAYLEENSRKDQSTIPVYGLAYRIMVPAPEFARAPAGAEGEEPERNYISIGAKAVPPDQLGKFEFTDFATVMPGDVYLEVNGHWRCQDGSFVRGIDPFYQSPICLKMGSKCVKGEIGKQLQISGNTLYVDCVPFRKYECSDPDYVISWISPKYLDSDYSGAEKPGECVYKGVRKDSATFKDPKRVQQRCGSKYEMDVVCTGKAVPTSMCVGPADPETGVPAQVAPNCRSADGSKSKVATNTYNCDLVLGSETQICPAGYSGGSCDYSVEMKVTCELRPEDEYRPLKGM